MFDVYCEGHASNVLLTTRHIERLHNGPDGVTVDWRCWCGTTGRLVRGHPAPVALADRPKASTSGAEVSDAPAPAPSAASAATACESGQTTWPAA